MMQTNIALVGDYSAKVRAHLAIPQAFALLTRQFGVDIGYKWIDTESVEHSVAPLSPFHAIWCVPGSPYQSLDGALQAIRFARERKIPFLGSCGGFQHALIEYARNVTGIVDADHAETSPDGSSLVIRPLLCSLRGVSGDIYYLPGTKLYGWVGKDKTHEKYFCSFGFNREFRSMFADGNLTAAAVDDQGELRAFELRDHPFFVGTLFQPELHAEDGIVHPIIEAFFRAAMMN